MTPSAVHDRLSITATLFTFAMASWATVLALRGRGVDGNYVGSVIVGELLLVAQALLGAWLWWWSDIRPDRGGIHLLYGLTAVLVWPFVLSLDRGSGGRTESARFALATWFLWGLVLRAISTGNVA